LNVVLLPSANRDHLNPLVRFNVNSRVIGVTRTDARRVETIRILQSERVNTNAGASRNLGQNALLEVSRRKQSIVFLLQGRVLEILTRLAANARQFLHLKCGSYNLL